MINNVLIVDDDQDLLLMTREGLERYAGRFSVLTAEDGKIAVEKLRDHPVSLVLTDLKMPRMDGFGLLAHIAHGYPDVPVIVMTGYGTPSLERRVSDNGAIGYIQKPFVMEELARRIILTLQRESEGGTLHGFSTGVFVQLVEAEQKTCTIRVFNRRSSLKGVLFFRGGELMDARVNGITGVDAAYTIFSWDDVSFSIQNTCDIKKRVVDADLQAILLEAMRRKDENSELHESAGGPSTFEPPRLQ